MAANRNNKLIFKVLIIGAVIAVLSYLFHPEVGQISLIINGQPVAEPMVRFAAIPTFLIIIGMTCVLMVLLFFGFGMLLFLGALIFTLSLCFVMAPYFWPVLAVIFFIIATMSFSHDQK
jgi:hypothetical protein